ncbi:unnamed protein product [Brassica rapa subsp. trilocularis]
MRLPLLCTTRLLQPLFLCHNQCRFRTLLSRPSACKDFRILHQEVNGSKPVLRQCCNFSELLWVL